MDDDRVTMNVERLVMEHTNLSLNVMTDKQRERILISFIVEGKAVSWIEYTAEQVDDFMKVLKKHRDSLRQIVHERIVETKGTIA